MLSRVLKSYQKEEIYREEKSLTSDGYSTKMFKTIEGYKVVNKTNRHIPASTKICNYQLQEDSPFKSSVQAKKETFGEVLFFDTPFLIYSQPAHFFPTFDGTIPPHQNMLQL